MENRTEFQSRFGSPIFGELAHETLVSYFFLMGLIWFRFGSLKIGEPKRLWN